MHERLQKIYFSVLTPAVIGFFVIYLVNHLHGSYLFSNQVVAFIAPRIFFLAVVFAVAAPVFYRSVFAYHRQNHKGVHPMELFKLERNITLIALVTPYLALAAYYLQLPCFYLTGTILMALYAIYYYYPSRKRIMFDCKLFRTGEVSSSDRTR
jgi:hypothetical protein